MENDDLKIKDGRVVTDAALVLTRQSVSAQREVTSELRDKAAVDDERDPALKGKAENTAEQEDKKASARDDTGSESQEQSVAPRSSLILDIDA